VSAAVSGFASGSENMRLLLVSDLHGMRDTLRQIFREAGAVDAALLAGDLTNFGSPLDAETMVRLAAEHAPAVFAVAGNCDSAPIDRHLAELDVALHGRGVVHGGLRLQGLSAMPPWKHNMYQFTEEQLAEALAAGWLAIKDAMGPHVVLAHAPPRGTLDRTWLFRHVGSVALRQFIESVGPALVVCGHIHEGRGVERVGTTTVVNCGHGALGDYAVAEIGSEVRVEIRRV
jgi:Icc-related predicted phosphoesterase